MPENFRSSANRVANKEVNRILTKKIHDFSNIFTGIGSFYGTFKLLVGEGSCPYQGPPKRVASALQESLKEELERLQKQQIIVLLYGDETSEWCNNLALVPKANGKVSLCLDLVRLISPNKTNSQRFDPQ